MQGAKMITPDELNDPGRTWPYYTFGQIVLGDEKAYAVLLRSSPPDQERVDVILLDDLDSRQATAGKLIAIQRHQFRPICENSCL